MPFYSVRKKRAFPRLLRVFLSPPLLCISKSPNWRQNWAFPFFSRNHYGISLTQAGQEYFFAAQKADILLAEAQKNAEALSRGAQILRISMETSEYASGLKAFELAYPDVLIRHVETPYDDIQFVYDLLCNHQLDVHEGEYTHDIETRGLFFIPFTQTYLCAMTSLPQSAFRLNLSSSFPSFPIKAPISINVFSLQPSCSILSCSKVLQF